MSRELRTQKKKKDAGITRKKSETVENQRIKFGFYLMFNLDKE